ncbi:hypothetical protein IPF37_02035 [bacterium]|nr:MAG: hypothetical protein IPF37_02035 [bacterium]
MEKKTIAALSLINIFYTISGYGTARELFLYRSKSELSAAQQSVIIIVATNTQIPFLYFKEIEKKIDTIFSHLAHIKKLQPREEERFFNFFKHLLAARPGQALTHDIMVFAQEFGLTQSMHNAFFLIKNNGMITDMAHQCIQVIITELIEDFYCHFTINELEKMRKIKIKKNKNQYGKKESIFQHN